MKGGPHEPAGRAPRQQYPLRQHRLAFYLQTLGIHIKVVVA
ncbi:hypothetical protein [Amycolatopsis sp. NPDC004079]